MKDETVDVRHITVELTIGGVSVKFKALLKIEDDEPVGFHGWCPAFKGLHVPGDTVEETAKFAKDALIAYLESMIGHGDTLPIGVQ